MIENPHFLTIEDRLDLDLNDQGNASRLLAVYGGDLLFVGGRGWAVWDGLRYSFRMGDLAAREIGHRLREIVLDEAGEKSRRVIVERDEIDEVIAAYARKRPPKIISPEAAEFIIRSAAGLDLRKHAIKCGNVAKVETALRAAEHRLRIGVDEMDADPWALVVQNGEIDLRAVRAWEKPDAAAHEEVVASRRGWLRPITRALRHSKCAGVAFDPAADCPNWLAFLKLILPDPHIRDCVQRCLGACLLGQNRAQVCLFLRGPGGNGKSTLLNILTHVLGANDGYAASCKIEMFLETGHQQSGAATPEESDLPGARAYIATEPGARDVLSAKKIKALTGGDRRMSRGLYSDPFFWTPTGVPLISCNRTPKIKDEDEGTRRRLIFLPFDVNLRALAPEKQRSQGEVEAELRAEGSGVLNWLLEGFQGFMERGIDMPEPMSRLKAQLLESADPVGVFLDEMTRKDPNGRLNVTEFYNVHARWCEREGRTLYQMKTVGDVMVEKGFERGKSNGLSVWRGLVWLPDAADLVHAAGYTPPADPRPSGPDSAPF